MAKLATSCFATESKEWWTSSIHTVQLKTWIENLARLCANLLGI